MLYKVLYLLGFCNHSEYVDLFELTGVREIFPEIMHLDDIIFEPSVCRYKFMEERLGGSTNDKKSIIIVSNLTHYKDKEFISSVPNTIILEHIIYKDMVRESEGFNELVRKLKETIDPCKNEFQKYEYTIFDVMSDLHCSITGTLECFYKTTDKEYFWLKQRIENWTESIWAKENSFIGYNELLIKTLATFILKSYKFKRLKFEDFDGEKTSFVKEENTNHSCLKGLGGYEYKGIDTFVPGLGTVRECIDCKCLIAGGPTRCLRCAK